ncbi:MAG: 3-isopropylmalate dehydratase [Clostridia bacterium]|nr:3-isopropylmalate dehydratase [Clostridia bacterium]
MSERIEGKSWICGDSVTVYQVLAESHWTMKQMDAEEMSHWVFDELEPRATGKKDGFRNLGYDIVIAGKCFGCGSKSVEHPMAALKAAGVKLIIAESTSRCSYRNAINLALPVLLCPDITKKVHPDDVLSVDILEGNIKNLMTGEEWSATGLGLFAGKIISAGGMMEMIRQRRKEYGL